MSELKPCPFCGGEAELRDDGEAGYPYYVQCVECGGMTDGYLHADRPFGAIDAWNARAERTCRIENTNGEWCCSCCGEAVGSDDPWCELFTNGNAIELWNYCPNCGAKVVSE